MSIKSKVQSWYASTTTFVKNNKKEVKIGLITFASLALLAFSSFFITNMLIKVNSNTHNVEKDPNILSEDKLPEYTDDLVKNQVTKPGTTIKAGDSGKGIFGVDTKTNKPFIGSTEIVSVKKADDSNIGGFILPDELKEKYGAQAWYLTVKTTVDERPSDYTVIPSPVYVSNDRTPMDEGQHILPRNNPECLWGPEMWGQVKGKTATRCITFLTFDKQPPGDIHLANYALDLEKYPEYAEKSAKYEYKVTSK